MKIRALGLQIAESKTDVVFFHRKKVPNRFLRIIIDRHTINPAPAIKYLGVYIDSR